MDAWTDVCNENEFHGESGATKLQERLQQRHQARLEDAELRKEAKKTQSLSEEKAVYFYAAFSKERESVEELLSGCSGADKTTATQKLEEATGKMLLLQKFLNDSMPFLAPYHLEQAQAALQKLQASLAETRETILPKKKFAFKARTKAADKLSAHGAVTPPTDADKPADSGVTKVDGAPAFEPCGFSNINNETLTKSAEEIQNRDLLLTHLTNCKVRLYGSPNTLHLKHIDSCEILCGPVSTSVFVDYCKDSTLAFPCQQLRTHNSTDIQVYLHVTSRAIIEDCRGVSFAPFSWSYPTLQEDFSVSGLDQGRNNWNQVDDFNWLAAGTASPNWTVIPEADRKSTWDP